MTCAGVVIGEAARVGDHVTLMQYVTLGGTGKETGDRHPKVLECAQVAAHSTVLGAPLLPCLASAQAPRRLWTMPSAPRRMLSHVTAIQ